MLKASIAAAICFGSIAVQAAVMPLYSELMAGDLPDHSLGGGSPPTLAVTTAGISTVQGAVFVETLSGGGGDGDLMDAFRFSVAAGLRVTRIAVEQDLGDSVINPARAYYGLTLEPAFLSNLINESVGSGHQLVTLFDGAPGGFVPIEATATPWEMFIAFAQLPARPTVVANAYTILIEAERVAAVPEPNGLALSVPTLLLAGAFSRRCRRPVAHPRLSQA